MIAATIVRPALKTVEHGPSLTESVSLRSHLGPEIKFLVSEPSPGTPEPVAPPPERRALSVVTPTTIRCRGNLHFRFENTGLYLSGSELHLSLRWRQSRSEVRRERQ